MAKRMEFEQKVTQLIGSCWNGGMIKELSLYSPLIDIINFIKAYDIKMTMLKFAKEELLKQAAERIKEQLIKIGWTPELIAKLKETNAYIAGSFPLQCLLGEFWEESDIDIFVPPSDEHKGARCEKLTCSFFGMDPPISELLAFSGFSKEVEKYCHCDEETKRSGRCFHLPRDISYVYWHKRGDQLISYLKEERVPDEIIIIRILNNLSRWGERHDNVYSVSAYFGDLLVKHFPEYASRIKDSIAEYDRSGRYERPPSLGKLTQVFTGQNDITSAYNELSGIIYIDGFRFGNKKVQIIHIKDPDPINFVTNDFDFDFCKVLFDGEKMIVYDWESVITMSSVIHGKAKETRIAKYQRRGFTIRDIA